MPFSQLPLIIEKLKFVDSRLVLVDAHVLFSRFHPAFNPEDHAIIFDVLPGEQAEKIRMLLLKIYDEKDSCEIFQESGPDQWQQKTCCLGDINHIQSKAIVSIPPALPSSSLESFQNLISHLRAPNGCPWDREQTQQSLRSNLLEETYEVLKALDEKDDPALMEELGDLLLQIVMHAQISSESGEFNLSQVIQGIHKKIVHRHPHVFGDTAISDSKGVIRKWDELKSIERRENGKGEGHGILESVPQMMPALSLAQEYQKRAARVGFDWPEIKPVVDKVYEELEEIAQASTLIRREEELGDLLFAVVNLVRWYEVDAESALRKMTARFHKRFVLIEDTARLQGKKMQEMTLVEMDALWEQAKKQGL
jgi:tetrapyrrole methylase family protein / MazG family protein